MLKGKLGHHQIIAMDFIDKCILGFEIGLKVKKWVK